MEFLTIGNVTCFAVVIASLVDKLSVISSLANMYSNIFLPPSGSSEEKSRIV